MQDIGCSEVVDEGASGDSGNLVMTIMIVFVVVVVLVIIVTVLVCKRQRAEIRHLKEVYVLNAKLDKADSIVVEDVMDDSISMGATLDKGTNPKPKFRPELPGAAKYNDVRKDGPSSLENTNYMGTIDFDRPQGISFNDSVKADPKVPSTAQGAEDLDTRRQMVDDINSRAVSEL